MPVSFSPEDSIKGGLLDDVTVEWSNSRFTAEPPPNYNIRDRVFFVVDLTVQATGEKTEGYWSFGDLTKYTILDNGDSVEGPALNDSTNAFFLFKSLEDKGFPKAALKAGKASALNGLVAHMIRFRPTRAGLSHQKEQKEGQQESGTLIVDKIERMPGEKGKGGRSGKAVAAASSTATAGASSGTAAGMVDVEKLADTTLATIVAGAGGEGINSKSMKVQIFRALGDAHSSETKNDVAAHVTENWLTEHGYTVKDGKITM